MSKSFNIFFAIALLAVTGCNSKVDRESNAVDSPVTDTATSTTEDRIKINNQVKSNQIDTINSVKDTVRSTTKP